MNVTKQSGLLSFWTQATQGEFSDKPPSLKGEGSHFAWSLSVGSRWKGAAVFLSMSLPKYHTGGMAMSKTLSTRIREAIYTRDNHICFYCGRIVRKLTAPESYLNPCLDQRSVDHKTPPSKGGSNSYDNLITACRSCNSQKGELTLEEYREFLSKERGKSVEFRYHLRKAMEVYPTPYDGVLQEILDWVDSIRYEVSFAGERQNQQ